MIAVSEHIGFSSWSREILSSGACQHVVIAPEAENGEIMSAQQRFMALGGRHEEKSPRRALTPTEFHGPVHFRMMIQWLGHPLSRDKAVMNTGQSLQAAIS